MFDWCSMACTSLVNCVRLALVLFFIRSNYTEFVADFPVVGTLKVAPLPRDTTRTFRLPRFSANPGPGHTVALVT